MNFRLLGSAVLSGMLALGTSALAQNTNYPQTPVQNDPNQQQTDPNYPNQNQQNYPNQNQQNYPNQNYPNQNYPNNYPNQQTGTYGPNGNMGYSTLPAGTEISVRSNQNIDSKQAQPGQTFDAEIENNVTDQSGNIVIPKGAQATLELVSTKGTLGRNELALSVQSVNINGQPMMLQTNAVQGQNPGGIGANKRTGVYVGGGALIGTVIGAMAGGAKGAAIGAAVGAAGGAGTQVLTKGNQVKVPAETVLNFKLDQPVSLQPMQ